MKILNRLILITAMMGLSLYPRPTSAAETTPVSTRSVLEQLKQQQQIFLVDIRRPEEFSAVRIPDSINVPLYFIKTKAFLKNNPVVLVDGGYPDGQTEAACRELNKSGFRVSILSGGLLAWQRSGGQLNGDLFFPDRYKHISALEFYQEKDRKDQVVIDVSERQNSQAKRLLPETRYLPFPRQLTAGALRAAAAGKKLILIFNDTGAGYEEIEKIVAQTNLENVFFLEGGLAGYRTYLSNQDLALQARDSRVKKTVDCAPCGQRE
ncbi:MAG: rhodanese-like domain-containing protein [Desulfobacterales bacterium]|nr:rhodanese-like domain-containing protein [Desulfobacterales bacterium]